MNITYDHAEDHEYVGFHEMLPGEVYSRHGTGGYLGMVIKITVDNKYRLLSLDHFNHPSFNDVLDPTIGDQYKWYRGKITLENDNEV